MLLVNEIFCSLQGEGVTMGYPAAFLRLTQCNLHCIWCDSKHAWHEGTELEIDAIIEQISLYRVNRLIVTGGEPLLQKEELDLLLRAIPDWHIEIETNGTIMPTAYQLARCSFNVSPKLSNAKNERNSTKKEAILQALNSDTVKSSFKFVVNNVADFDEIEQFAIDKDKIIIMPQGKNRAEIQATANNIIDEVIRRRYRFLSRLHVELWDNQRGK